ncbi:hypothetical protein G7074_15480 [Pedobacter sp. HDW13]|uniref:hypothetical protein n=1 Tax=unclassified Pedobacter TaxID=2628915 RepID=UPI000F59B0D3|nr:MULTISPECIES: hypothetical protein [unclassified Pedobacter]QIL40544.1 hypothetical protein G7074_15480 [Pedobacter sp. HDW13]RQO66897.1 hypothetical protein DBR40_21845 [Pedobacter sp. KBW01]
MNKVLKVLFFILVVMIFFASIIFFVEKSSNNKMKKDNAVLEKNFKQIQFKGKVIKSTIINRFGKQYYIICIKLEYSNIKDFYLFKEAHGLIIKNGIATMSGGIFMEDKIVDRVEVNINNSNKEKFFYKNGEIDEFELSFGAGAIKESDMNVCN